MKHLCFVRRIDELGRVVLPIEIRKILDIKEKDPLEIFFNDNKIFIKKKADFCIFCNSKVNLKNFLDKIICEKCIQKIKEDN